MFNPRNKFGEFYGVNPQTGAVYRCSPRDQLYEAAYNLAKKFKFPELRCHNIAHFAANTHKRNQTRLANISNEI